jgi:hypothetical protein
MSEIKWISESDAPLELNPALDPRVVPLFPHAPHLYAFMRCVVFHPDYSPFIPFGEQLPLARKIVDEHKGYILTVGDIIYYCAGYAEKRNPAPPGVTRAHMIHPPRKTTAQQTIFAGLLDDETTLAEDTSDVFAFLRDAEPEIATQTVLTGIYNLLADNPAAPKEENANDTERGNRSGDEGNLLGQGNLRAAGHDDDKPPSAPDDVSQSRAPAQGQVPARASKLAGLFSHGKPQGEIQTKKPGLLGGLFTKQSKGK